MALAGAGLMLTAAFLFSLMGLMIKLLGPDFRVWDVAMYRFAGGLTVLLIGFGWQGHLFAPSRPGMMWLRGLVGAFAFVFFVTALKFIPFSTAVVIFFTFPAFTALFTPLLFGEPIPPADLLLVSVAIAGVAVLFDFRLETEWMGQAMALVSAMFAGLTVALIKKLGETNGPVIIYFYLCLVGTLISISPFLTAPRLPSTGSEYALLASIIAISSLGQITMNHGFRYCKSWEGGLYMTSEVIFASLLAVWVLHETLTWRFWLGGSLIIASALAFNLRK